MTDKTGSRDARTHTAFEDRLELAAPSGARLNVYRQAAAAPARGIVHVNHGVAEHAARYGRFARALAAAGWHVYAHDHRGHGGTRAPDAPPGVFSLGGDGIGKVMADCAAVQDHARAAHGGLPVVMFGHSMGGLIAMNHALAHAERLAGVAVWNANLARGIAAHAARIVLGWERLRLGSDVPSRLLPRLTFAAWAKAAGDGRTPFDWLSHVEAEVDAYIADPLCGWDPSVGLWQAVFAMMRRGADVAGASARARALPFHLVGGGKDPATANGAAVRAQAERLRRAGFADVTVAIYPDGRHETLNDRVAGPATAHLLVWLDTHVRRDAAG
ncbi:MULTISPECIES: alpha/beta hydrolase [unclassified Roseitalea]|uniref:alpha/beta fold hydrolase n=1 Tax=unclassified Roseitalea TaxID=2639107 RepID=UPI0027401B30|nr:MULTISPECIES: alpha/beta hydrolase [unclassified Roseitalea]